MKSVSVAEAKNHLPQLLHESEQAPIQIMRRGKPVAVLMSTAQFERTRPHTEGIVEAAARCRTAIAKLRCNDAQVDPFVGLRDPDPGRRVRFLR